MAAEMVGGALVSAFLEVLFDRLASTQLLELFLEKNIDTTLLHKLKIILLTLYAALNDAEEKQITNLAVKHWLDELKDAVYDAEDLLDEMATESLRCKIEAESMSNIKQVTKQFYNFPNRNKKGIILKIERITRRLECIAKQKDILGLRENVGGKSSHRLPSTSLIDDDCIYGRSDDSQKILKLLVADCTAGDELCVFVILGMGGIGKTALAQLLYNNVVVNEYFELKAWVCVSEGFDVVRVTKTILESLTKKPPGCNNLDQIQVDLKERLRGKKFFIVLDDVWNENYNDWDILRRPFKAGAHGSKIIVTTRNETVALIMGTVPIHRLELLSDEDCWSLFAKHAFKNGNLDALSDLEERGKQIVKKCKGLPLAAKTLGGLLRCKLNIEEWDKILKSKIWDLPNDRSDIIPALRLSYHYLPSHLKQCFAYCSIFPKDYEFEKEKLVLLWMAEGYLEQITRNKQMEEVGDEYFNELLSRSIFQKSSSHKSSYVMHDLISDLAQYVSGEFCLRLEDDSLCSIPVKARHFSYIRSDYDAYGKFKLLNESRCLRTFLQTKLRPCYAPSKLTSKVPNDLLPRLGCLRVISLSSVLLTKIPDSIGNLKLLRYLDLSYTSIRALPESLASLYNLQTLLLLNCQYLTRLPTGLRKLINLRHLDIHGVDLTEMPMQMGALKNLRTLSKFMVGKEIGSRIEELKDLRFLSGTLSISSLQNVVNPTDAYVANLKDKKFLKKLETEWVRETDNSENERDVLDNLQPSSNLKELVIKNYGGTRFPFWLGCCSFSNIERLSLEGCRYCFSLPPLGQLPYLKKLSIIGNSALVRVGPEFYGDDSSGLQPFQLLMTLTFEDMVEWEEWWLPPRNEGIFPNLQELRVSGCPKLRGALPNHLPHLVTLTVSGCPQIVSRLSEVSKSILQLDLRECDEQMLLKSVVDLPYLRKLSIYHFSHLTEFPFQLHMLTSLKKLTIKECPNFQKLHAILFPTTLKDLGIHKCSKLELVQLFEPVETMMHRPNATLEFMEIEDSLNCIQPFRLPAFTMIKSLYIYECRTLESIWILELPHPNLANLIISSCPNLFSFPERELRTPKLTTFTINACKKLKSLPQQMQNLSSLESLDICGCPEVVSFPEGGLPPNLTSLGISGCYKLLPHCTLGLQRLSSLRMFTFTENEELESFPMEGLLPRTLTTLRLFDLRSLKSLNSRGHQQLTSLETLMIWNCPNLKTLEKETLQNLVSLRELEIRNCSQLHSLPEDGFSSHFISLRLLDCPLLKETYQNEKVQDWSKFAHIPCVQIDDELL